MDSAALIHMLKPVGCWPFKGYTDDVFRLYTKLPHSLPLLVVSTLSWTDIRHIVSSIQQENWELGVEQYSNKELPQGLN